MNRWMKWSIVGSVMIAAALAPVPGRAAQNDAPPPPADKNKTPTPTLPNVTMDLRDATLRQALSQLFLTEKVDYSIDTTVQGYVTLKITDQPFENALRLLLRAGQTPLTYRVDSGVYMVYPRTDRATGIAGRDDSSLARPVAELSRLDGSNQIVAGGPQWDTIALTYLDPVDVAQLLNIIIIPTFSRQGAQTIVGGGGGAGNISGTVSTMPGTGGAQSLLPIAPTVPIRISQ